MWIEIFEDIVINWFALVTSYAEVWIEIFLPLADNIGCMGHLLRGGVD